MNTLTIKQIWLDYFKDKGHSVEPSASLIPLNDPSLLWINAGVAPLKGYFEGTEVPKNVRLVNAQKCIRTNDIEQVGKTARHHTFFEMLGNFSIGDYFRDAVLPWAFELLTSEKYYHFPLEKLYFTVYPDDQETARLWASLGVPNDQIIPTEYNFWEIGEGPCGPSTEIFYDRGDAYGPNDPTMIEKDIENDRFIEIWNIVFSQYNAQKGVARSAYKELPNKNIDTGMGLERMACILQDVPTNFETDLFMPMMRTLEEKSQIAYSGQMAFKVIADHVRSVVFALADGAQLSNEGRGYVLRRLLRRAVKHGKTLGFQTPFLYTLVPKVVQTMQESYPYLVDQTERLAHVIQKEEVKFLETLHAGEKRLESWLKESADGVSGAAAFKLYDTYGFPVELTQEMAEAAGKTVDLDGFHAALLEQKERARSARHDSANMRAQDAELMAFNAPFKFVGYETLEVTSQVTLVTDEGIVTAETPFYAESGGQVSDQGTIIKGHDTYEVLDVVKLPGGQFLHVLDDFSIEQGDHVVLKVNPEIRRKTEKHHSVTHLVYHQLRALLGDHISQQGSNVSPDHMRFDFSHDTILSDEELLTIERLTNQDIHNAHPVKTVITSVEEAKKRGATAEFGEKYTADVRMVDMEVTLDLCGGTHVKNTQDIGHYAITSIESKGSGIYRIMGLVKEAFYRQPLYLKGFIDAADTLYAKALDLQANPALKTPLEIPKKPVLTHSYGDVIALRQYIDTLQSSIKTLEKAIQTQTSNQALDQLDAWLNEAHGKRLVIHTFDLDVHAFKTLIDRLYDHVKGTVAGVNQTDKLMIVVKTSEASVNAGTWVKEMAQKAGGGGGGNPTFAQAGAKDITKAKAIIHAFKEGLY